MINREDVRVGKTASGLLVTKIKPHFPSIIVPGPKAPREMPKGESHTHTGECSKCGKKWRFTVGNMSTYGEVDSDEDEHRTRALNLFLAYIRKGVCPCCWTAEDRIYIAKHAGSVLYERLD